MLVRYRYNYMNSILLFRRVNVSRNFLMFLINQKYNLKFIVGVSVFENRKLGF